MADIEDKRVQSMTMSEEEKKAKHKTNTMALENLQPSSLQVAENTILDEELGNPAEFQETENKISSLINTSNLPTLSKMLDNQSSVVPETDIVAHLSMQEVKNQSEFHISRAEKTSTTLPEQQIFKLQTGKNDSTESESLQPSSLQITESTMSPILDLELRNLSKIQVPENRTSSSTNISNLPMFSKILNNQSSVVPETGVVAPLSMQEVKNQNEFHISKVEKTSKILSEDKEPPLQKHENDATESASLKPSHLQMAESAMSPILDLEIGDPSESQQAENKMSSLAIKMPTLARIHSNQSSVKPETDIVNQLHVQEVSSQITSQISSVLQNIEQVDGKKFSIIPVSQNNLQLILNSGIKLTQAVATRYHAYRNNKLKEATMLPLLALEDNEAVSKRNRSLVLLKIMEYIKSWLDKIKERNEYYTELNQQLNKIVTDFSTLEEKVEEKLNFLSMGRSFSNLEHSKQSEYETIIYDSLYNRGRRLLILLKYIKKEIDAAFLEYRKSRLHYVNNSYQIAMYPFEEKLLERGKTLIDLTNKLSVLLNNTTVKLVEKCSFIHFFAFHCLQNVERYFKDIDMAFSV